MSTHYTTHTQKSPAFDIWHTLVFKKKKKKSVFMSLKILGIRDTIYKIIYIIINKQITSYVDRYLNAIAKKLSMIKGNDSTVQDICDLNSGDHVG